MTKKAAEDKTIAVGLTIGERVQLLQVLPEKGPIATMRLVRKLNERLGFTTAEIKDHQILFGPDGRVQWQDVKWERTFRFGGFELEMIMANLRRLNDANTLTMAHVSLWDKFIPEPAVGLGDGE